MIAIKTCDGQSLQIPESIAIKSEVIRHMIDEFESESDKAVITLQHESCTLKVMQSLLHFLMPGAADIGAKASEFEEICRGRSNEESFNDITAANFLEIQELIQIMAHSRGPLHIASAKGDLDVVKALIDASADLDALDQDGHAVLQVTTDAACIVAIEQAKTEAALLRQGFTPLMIHARGGDISRVRAILAQSVSREELVNATDNEGKAAIHHVAEQGHVEILTELIQAKAAIDLKNKVIGSIRFLPPSRAHISPVRAL
jgi:ankyrin repeat protein